MSEIPAALPLMGEQGVGSFDYPLETADSVALLGLLRMRRFGDLEKWMNAYQDAADTDFHKEEWPIDAFASFEIPDADIGSLIDDWTTSYPESWAAHAARATHLMAIAFHNRGGDWARLTDEEQVAQMRKYHARARREVREAIKRRPGYTNGFRQLIRIGMFEGTKASERRELYETARRRCPLCYNVHTQYLGSLLPKWGGSTAAVRAFLAEVAALKSNNPRLALFAGVGDAMRCEILHDRKDYAAAEAACDDALRFGELRSALTLKASMLRRAKRYKEAIAMTERGLRVHPSSLRLSFERMYALWSLRRHVEAATLLARLRARRPNNRGYAKASARLVGQLREYGRKSYTDEAYEDASSKFAAALALAPNDRDLTNRLAWSDRKLGADALSAMAAKSPSSFLVRRRLDAVLVLDKKMPQVIAMWTAYLERHPDDPRALREVAGTRWRSGQRQAGLRDMAAACRLSLRAACVDEADMRRRLAPKTSP